MTIQTLLLCYAVFRHIADLDNRVADRDRQIVILVSFHPETSRSIRLLAPNYTGKYSRKIPGLNPDTSSYLTDPSYGKYFMTYIIKNVHSLITNILAA